VSIGQSLVVNLRGFESGHFDLPHPDNAVLIFSFGHSDRRESVSVTLLKRVTHCTYFTLRLKISTFVRSGLRPETPKTKMKEKVRRT